MLRMKKRHIVVVAVAVLAAGIGLIIMDGRPRSGIFAITTDMRRSDVEDVFGSKPFFECRITPGEPSTQLCFALNDGTYAWIEFNSHGKVTNAFYCDGDYYDMSATQKIWNGIRRLWR